MSKRLSFQASPVCPPPPVRRAFLTPACGFWDLGQGAKPGLHGDRSASPPASRPGRRVFCGDRAPRLRPDAPRAAWKQAVRANKAQPGGKAVSPKTNLCGSGSIGWAAAPSAVRTCPAAGWGESDKGFPFSVFGKRRRLPALSLRREAGPCAAGVYAFLPVALPAAVSPGRQGSPL